MCVVVFSLQIYEQDIRVHVSIVTSCVSNVTWPENVQMDGWVIAHGMLQKQYSNPVIRSCAVARFCETFVLPVTYKRINDIKETVGNYDCVYFCKR